MIEDLLRAQLDETAQVARYLQGELARVRRVADALIGVITSGHRILLCGNGGSALDAQHFAAELVGHFRADRMALPALALSCDAGIITAVANDFDFAHVFARQVEALGTAGDALIGISTSGTSRNVLAALEVARCRGLVTVGMSGAGGGEMRGSCDYELFLPFSDTARIQEGHLMLVHLLAECVDAAFAARPSQAGGGQHG